MKTLANRKLEKDMVRLYRGNRISRMLLDKEVSDGRLSVIDRSSWYVPRESLLTEKAAASFHLSYLDQATQSFLDESLAISNSICLQSWYALASTMLSMFVSKTSSNGILNRGGMFIFSSEQLRDFLELEPEWDKKGKKVLDLGAGDGGVTASIGELYDTVYATEMSLVMQWRLRERGFNVLDVDDWKKGEHKYDLISALNLLDRHYNPAILLSEIHSVALSSRCLVVIAIVLPVRQYVEFHPNGKHTRPDTWINVEGDTYEAQVNTIIENQFQPSGFKVIRWTKLPYLCEGDFQKPYYFLSDAVFLLQAIPKENRTVHDVPNVIHSEL